MYSTFISQIFFLYFVDVESHVFVNKRISMMVMMMMMTVMVSKLD